MSSNPVAAKMMPGRRKWSCSAEISTRMNEIQRKKKNRFSDKRLLSTLPIERHNNADEHQCGDRAGALTAKPREGLHRNGKALLQCDRHDVAEHAAFAPPHKVKVSMSYELLSA